LSDQHDSPSEAGPAADPPQPSSYRDRYTQIANEAYKAISDLLTVLSNDEARYIGVLIKRLQLGLQKVTLDSLLEPNKASVEKRFTELRLERLKSKFRLDKVADEIDNESAALEKATRDLEKDLEARGLPIAPPSPSSLSGDERFKLHATLLRLYPSLQLASLPPPDDHFTGIAGKSRVFLFSLRHSDTEIRLMAKFDRPDRAAREWAAIQELRLLHVPAEAILPLAKNDRADGVILYPVAGDHRLKSFVTLSGYLASHLVTAPDNGVRCLEQCLDCLGYFYEIEPGRVDDRFPRDSLPYLWSDFFPEVPSEGIARPVLDRPELTTGAAGEVLALANNLKLPDPFSGLDRLPKYAGHLRLSRIHGDLNLSNILVCPDLDQSPSKVFIIDLADSKPGRATAIDLARIEVELWLRVYSTMASQSGEPFVRWAKDLIAVHDILEDRNNAERSPASTGALRFLYRLRKRAAIILAPHHSDRYMLHDYYLCLYFTYLTQLGYMMRTGNPDVGCLLLARLGASVALRFLGDWGSGIYSPGGSPHRGSPCRRIAELEQS
jgi:hypothetical protein